MEFTTVTRSLETMLDLDPTPVIGGDPPKIKHKKVSFDDVCTIMNETPPINTHVASSTKGAPDKNPPPAKNAPANPNPIVKFPRVRYTARLKPSVANPVNRSSGAGTSNRGQQPTVEVSKSTNRGRSSLGDRGDTRRGTMTKLPAVARRSVSEERQPIGNTYAKPELHSALQVAEALQNLNLDSFDARLAVRRKLDTSPNTKRRVVAASTRPVNIPSARVVYSDVMPLEFDEQQLLLASAKDREAREAKLKAEGPVPRPRDPQPLFDEFLTDNLQPEFVALPLPNTNLPALRRPCAPSNFAAYSLNKHKRIWEGLP